MTMIADKKLLEVEALAKDILQGQADPATTSLAFGYGSHSKMSEQAVDALLKKWGRDELTVADEANFELLVYDAMDAAAIALYGDTLQYAFAHLPSISGWVRELTSSLIKLNVQKKQTA